MPSNFRRRILHHGPDPQGTPVLLADRAVKGCWFELLRQGGCGSAELELADRFEAPHDVFPGDWISFEYAPGARWYLGRVEEIESRLPAGRRLRLEGMSIELNEIFPGGFGESADGAKPHRYGATDLFSQDPDRSLETADSVDSPDALLRLLLNQYVVGKSHIHVDTANIDPVGTPAALVSVKFHGEETVRSIIKDLAVRAGGAAWGVDQQGEFFFLSPRTTPIASYQQGRDITSLTQHTTREQLFNRILLTGDYVYDRRDYSGTVARRSYRWRANFVQPESRSQYGERRIRIWLPWIRTQQDALTFAREFFRTYANSQSSYLVETLPQESLPFPWLGTIVLQNQSGQEIARGQVETVRVHFDHAPAFRLEIGPSDPRQLWPEPPHDERWELPDERKKIGGDVSLPHLSLGGGETSPTSQAPVTNPDSSFLLLSSNDSLNSSLGTSLQSFGNSTISLNSSEWVGSTQFASSGTGTSEFDSLAGSLDHTLMLSGSTYVSTLGGTSVSNVSTGGYDSSAMLTSDPDGSLPESSQIFGSLGTSLSNSLTGTTSSAISTWQTGDSSNAYTTDPAGAGTTSSYDSTQATWSSNDHSPVTSSASPITDSTGTYSSVGTSF